MNGVRRLLGGASSSTSTLTPSEPATSPPSSTMPLFSKNSPAASSSSANTSWSPSMGGTQPLMTSPKATAGLSFKKDKPRPTFSDDIEGLDSWGSSNQAQQQSAFSPRSINRNDSLNSDTHSFGSSASSPRRVPVNGERKLSRRSTDLSTDSAWIVKRNSTLSTTRDELLMSLMASEAVVDSRGYDVLTAEEVEELKKEHDILSSRQVAMTKKLALETKIRDAAVSLSRINSSQKRTSQTPGQLEAANRRVDAAQQELWRISEQVSQVSRRLLEHRAAVLSISVRNMEKKMSSNGSEDSGYDSSNRSTLMSPATATSTLSSSSKQSQSKFDGAHLFAGHEHTIVPRKKMSPEKASKEITALEEKLKAATASLAESSKIQAEMKKELSHLKLEKQEVETMMGLELQTAEDTVATLQQEMPRLERLDQEVQELRQERAEWEEERRRLEEDAKEAAILRARVQELEMGVVEKTGGAEKMLNDLRESMRQEIAQKDEQIQLLRKELEGEKAEWERERNALEDEKMDDLAQLHQEMDRLREADEQVLQLANNELNTTLGSLRKIVHQFDIPLGERDPETSAMQHLLDAIIKQLDGVYGRLEQLEKSGTGNDAKSQQLEVELQAVKEKHQSLARELEEVKKERDTARRETMTSSSSRSIVSSVGTRGSRSDSVKALPLTLPGLVTVTPETSEYGPDVEGAKFIAALQPLWSILPSPELRASKFSGNSARGYRGSPTLSNASLPSPGGAPPPSSAANAPQPTSLSELDVRSLKTLYDPRQQAAIGSMNGQFTLEAFIARVNALVQDDRALIERLIRFAQAHDLLKKNAERAQKLAQDGNVALETYQKQVKALESRNASLSTKVTALQDEMRVMHDAVERITSEKTELESFAAEQAETCRQLSEANNTLSARALTLAEEAATAPEMVRKQLEDCKKQLGEHRKQLGDAREEIEAMRGAEQGQNIALLDELNSMQTENDKLRAQLRAAKSGK
ncbi:hypothetical protein D9611_002692 [Ephemerocybe angulata]|uniref:Up-regulated during septation protein 1 domain-containing protein n=1 Tax=Ephemerocybe angulata TaxID=980116 RepID=A0A8H5FEM7_9AGAR|nr:hypothetical protein D9611_002692 [Tulosesus angulatus]